MDFDVAMAKLLLSFLHISSVTKIMTIVVREKVESKIEWVRIDFDFDF